MTDKNRPFGIHTIWDIYDSSCRTGLKNGREVYAVAEPYTANRLTAAWWVLTGRAYALLWPRAGDLEVALGVPERKPPKNKDPSPSGKMMRAARENFERTKYLNPEIFPQIKASGETK